MQVTPTEKSWGPNYLRFGVQLEGSNKENSDALRVAYHRKWVNSLGGEWLSGGQFGERSNLFTQFYQPLDARQRFFVQPWVGVVWDSLNVYQDDHRIAQYRLRSRDANLGFGANVGTLGQVRLGVHVTQARCIGRDRRTDLAHRRVAVAGLAAGA